MKKIGVTLAIIAMLGTGAAIPSLAAEVPAVIQTSSNTNTAAQYQHGSMVGRTIFPEMAAHNQAYTKDALPAAIREAYDGNYKKGILAIGKADGKWKILGTNGSVRFGPFKKIEQVRPAVFKVTDEKGQTYYMDTEGHVVTSLPATSSEVSSQGLTKFAENGRYGFKNSTGQVVIPATLKEVYTDFSEGIAFVKNDKGKKVAIDETGKELFAAPYDEFFPYQDGLAEYRRHVSSFGLGNFLGMIVAGATGTGYYPEAMPYGGSLIYDGVKRGYLDKTGKIVIDSKNDEVYPISKFGTFVKNDDKLGFVNRQGTYIIAPGNYDIASNLMDDISGFAALKDNDTDKIAVFSLVDGTEVTKFVYDGVTIMGGERLLLTQGDTTYFVNTKTGTIVAQFPKDMKSTIFMFEDYTWFWDDNKSYQIINKDGQVMYTAPKGTISDVTSFRNGVSVVKSKGLYGIMDGHGNWVVQPTYKEIKLL